MFYKKYFTFENLFFYGLLVISLVNIWSQNIYVTIDGPTHLYNSGLLNLIGNDAFLKSFYVQNDLFLPNYFSHIVLSNLFLVFDPFTSEKIFFSLFVILLPLSFRYLAKLYAKNTLYSFLVFPLMFGFLFHVGFFNFCFAFVFLNFQLALLYFFLHEKSKWYHLLLFILNSIVLFNCHAFIFGITLIITFLITFLYFLPSWKVVVKKVAYLFLLYLPSCILFAVFYLKYQIPDYNYPTTDYEKFSKILTFAPAIVYNRETEGIKASVYLFVFFFLVNFIFFKRFSGNSPEKKFLYFDILLVIALGLIPIIINTNSGMLSGMLTDRLVLVFFYVIALWISFNFIESKGVYFVTTMLVVTVFWRLSVKRKDSIAQLSNNAEKIVVASNKVKDNSTVFSINFSDNWTEINFSNYLGIKKNIINLYNPEAVLGWFPIRWRGDRPAVNWEIDSTDKVTRLPDYILIYGLFSKLNNEGNEKLKQFIQANGVKQYQSADNYCTLYEIKTKK
jgi:hypothetical protein